MQILVPIHFWSHIWFQNVIEGEYRFRIRENERAIIVAALREYVEVLETLIKLHEDPRFKALEGEIPLPPREGLELMLNVAMNLEYRIEGASRGRVKKTSTKPMNPR
jgi:hypothetical protein